MHFLDTEVAGKRVAHVPDAVRAGGTEFFFDDFAIDGFLVQSVNADLEAAQRLQMAAIGAKGGVGSLRMSEEASKKYGADKAAFEAAYRRKMIETAKVAIDIELAILDGKADAAKALVAKLHDLEESGHEVFKGEEGGERGEGAEAPRNPGRGGRGGRGENAPANN